MGSRLLIVDDDDILRKAFRKTLESCGYEVFEAIHGKDALSFLSANQVDAVVSDIRMPEMDGLQLTKQIKNTYRLPVVLMTGFSEALETQEAHALGADEFLAKPFKRQDMIESIERCLKGTPRSQAPEQIDYCKVGIDDFVSGKRICFSIFVKLSEAKFVKIANRGEDLSIDRIRVYKSKGLHHLYLRSEDFRKYVGFSLSLTVAARNNDQISQEKRLNLLRHTGEILLERMTLDHPNAEIGQGAKTFVESTIGILSENPDIFSLLEALNSHSDSHYAHGVAVSFYSVMIAQAVGWDLPSNKFKVAMGGLLHDIGEKEIGMDLLIRPRHQWTPKEVQMFETHPVRGTEILSGIKDIPSDVVMIVKEHHEDGLTGYPSRLKKSMIHPMAKLISVADIFCDRVVRNPAHPHMPPLQALEHMSEFFLDRLDPLYFRALTQLFNFKPSAQSAS